MRLRVNLGGRQALQRAVRKASRGVAIDMSPQRWTNLWEHFRISWVVCSSLLERERERERERGRERERERERGERERERERERGREREGGGEGERKRDHSKTYSMK